MLKPLQLERYVKGFANHRRIQIIVLLDKNPDLNLLDISSQLKMNFKTVADHTRRLAVAGLIMKRHNSSSVEHALTDRGRVVLKFLRTLE